MKIMKETFCILFSLPRHVLCAMGKHYGERSRFRMYGGIWVSVCNNCGRIM